MDRRRPTGILYVNTHVDHPSKEVEYDRWYQDVHFADVTEPGVIVAPTMLHNARAEPPASEGKFLAFYECFWSDLEAAASAFAAWVDVLFTEERIHAGTAARLFALYRQSTLRFATRRRRRTQSLVAVHLDPRAGTSAAELRAGFADRLLPAVAELGLFHTLSFNELVRPEAFAYAMSDDQPTLLALYESDFGDPAALAARLQERFYASELDRLAEVRSESHWYRASP